MGLVTVLDSGLFTTVQDYGRPGYRKYGIPTSGVMDVKSYELANWLVGNSEGSAVLEFTMRGGRLRFVTDAIIACTGASINPRINGVNIPMNRSVQVKGGSELEMGFASRGCRTYIAIQGRIKIDKIMESYSTYTLGKLGGFEGRTLEQGDELTWEELSKKFEEKEAPKKSIPYFSSKVTVRVMKGLEWDLINEETIQKFLESKFEVSSQSNRMGIRLKGVNLEAPSLEMKSSAVLPGIIQLPPSGEPIILMQDGQTIGGYPRIAKVLDEDLWRVGQIKTGDSLGFTLI